MRSKATLMIATLGILAALFFFLVEQPRHTRETALLETGARVTSARAEDVRSVSIRRPDVTIKGVREGDRWRITSPVNDNADASAFNMLVFTACGATIERRFDAQDSELPEYGLADPSAEIRFEGADGAKLLELRVGDLNPSKSHCYALAADRREVILLPSGVRRYALRPLFEFRDKRIVDVEVVDVHRVEIGLPSASTTWTAGEHGRWFTVIGGDTVPGNKTELENVVRRLRGLRARDILFDQAAGDASVEAPAGTIRLTTRGDTVAITLTFTRPRGDACYVSDSRSGRTALVDTTMIPIFGRTFDSFRDKRILLFDHGVLAKIAWHTPGITRTIVKKNGAWDYANPAFGKIQEDTARRLISTLDGIEFAAVIEARAPAASGYGFEAPALRLTLLDSDDRVIDEAVFGSLLPDGVSRYAWSRSTRSLMTIAPTTATRLDDALSALVGP